MRSIAILAVVLILVLAVALRGVRQSRRAAARQSATNQRAAPEQTYLELRNLMLQGSRTKFGLAATSKPTVPWGVAMDLDVSDGTATLVAVSDGNASIYLSSGGGYLGGGGQPPIREAAKKFVELAAEFQPLMHSATGYPLPSAGQATFYLLTDAGVFTATAPEKDLNEHRHPMSKLFDAGQEVITQSRPYWDKTAP